MSSPTVSLPVVTPSPPPPGYDYARHVAETVVLRGTFTLRSGRTSDHYFDKYRMLTSPTLVAHGGVEVRNAVARLFPAQQARPRVLAASGYMAPILAAWAAAVDGLSRVLIVRDEAKRHGTGNRVEGMIDDGATDVVIVEDIVTSGGSVLETAAALREVGLVPLAVVALIDRCEGGRERIEGGEYPMLFASVFTGPELLALNPGVTPEGQAVS